MLRDHCKNYLSYETSTIFIREVINVCNSHIDGIDFINGKVSNDLPTYMNIRERSISLSPFIEVIKYEYLPREWRSHNCWKVLQKNVTSICGLQNDLIGLERDLEDGEALNAVVVLIKARGQGESVLRQCLRKVVKKHNLYSERLLKRIRYTHLMCGSDIPQAVVDVMRHMVMLTETHLKWVMAAKRYKVKSDQDTGMEV